MLFVILIAELILLFFLSLALTQRLFGLFLLIFRARSVAMSLILVLQFPGTVVHELAHLFSAGILGVRAGKLTLEPEIIRIKDKKTGASTEAVTKAGSVMIARSDPFRRYAIGLAPLVSGIIVLTALAFLLQNITSQGVPLLNNAWDWRMWGLGYLLFAVSNTMYPSAQDLKGFLPFAVALMVFAGVLYYLGIRVALTGAVLETALRVLTTLVTSLGVVAGINAVLLVITLGLTHLMTRIFHIRIIQ